MKKNNPTIKAILNPEEVFQFIIDINEQRKREIRLEDCVHNLSMDISALNLN